MAKEGRYIYCIIGTDKERKFGPIGIGEHGDQTYTIPYRDIAAVVSNTKETRYDISRKNTIAHEKVIEEVMKDYTVLPVRFCTIANPEQTREIKEKVLEKRYLEFKDLLKEMEDKVELGVKALWNNIEKIFQEIAEENAKIKDLKRRIVSEPPDKTRSERIEVGEMVKDALEKKKEREGKRILNALKGLSVDFRDNKLHGDKMILNAAFLAEKARQKEFDDRMNELEKEYGERIKFKYVGLVPPFNFVEIVVTWE
ncbi:GvpL/GvpF family gas vesicle protein [bacterium]|nr:GvpL/GvpF family gas vesicle protein [bacterium]MCG2677135.1 GvpL/GvpF family gas vesicle protein [bacterium]